MPYSLCDMDCDQEINKSDIEEHCSDCLCVGGMEDLDQQEMPATKAWRPTSVVEERDRPKTLSIWHPMSNPLYLEDAPVNKAYSTSLGIFLSAFNL